MIADDAQVFQWQDCCQFLCGEEIATLIHCLNLMRSCVSSKMAAATLEFKTAGSSFWAPPFWIIPWPPPCYRKHEIPKDSNSDSKWLSPSAASVCTKTIMLPCHAVTWVELFTTQYLNFSFASLVNRIDPYINQLPIWGTIRNWW